MSCEKKLLGFAPELIPLILRGEKTFTYRLGDKYRKYDVGDCVSIFDSKSGKIFCTVIITEKNACRFKDLPIDKEGHEKYPSKECQRQIFENHSQILKNIGI